MKLKDADLIKAEMKRVANILDELEELEIPIYIKDAGWNTNRLHYACIARQNSLKAELKNRLLMVRKDCLIIRDQAKEYRDEEDI